MRPARKQALLILLAVAALTLGCIVLARTWFTINTDLLAIGLLISGLAIVVVSLPVNGNGNGRGRRKDNGG